MERKKLVAMIMTLVVAMAMMTGCGSASGSAKAGEYEGELIMATNATFPPYEFVENGEYEGIDVEIAEKIAEELNLELVIEDVEFGSIIAGVESGKYDMGMAGMTVTDERKESVNFSETYAVAVQSVIVPAGSTIKSIDDISADTKIGVQQDTTGDIYATDDYGDEAIVRYKAGPDAVQALASGKVDCVIIDKEPAKAYVAANDGLELLESAYAEEEYAICVAKGNDELLEKINTALAKLKSDGTIDEIVSKYISAED
ncbi:MAG: transporter substrate-binding domain-containing protein [Pseudobutyrivibrio sp.]|nr:transporter substrate-binding domain-containing protein [Pseudobutyrivibrio sp.]